MKSKTPPPPSSLDVATERLLESLEARNGWTRRQAEIALAAGALIAALLFCGAVGTFAQIAGQPAAPTLTPTTVPLGVRSATEVMARLKQVGLVVTAVQNVPVSVPNASWQASQAVQFKVDTKVGTSAFLLLSYDSVDKAGAEAFRVTNATPESLKGWQFTQVANVLLAAAPDADPATTTAVLSHLTSYLLTPYRAALPTVTPSPAPTAQPSPRSPL